MGISQPVERSGVLFLIFSAMMDKCPWRNHVFDVAPGETALPVGIEAKRKKKKEN